LDEARNMIFFRLAADADQFVTIAKFQALRRLWRHVEEKCGIPFAPAVISARSAWRTVTRNDPHTNIMRAAVATFAPRIVRADAIAVLPFTQAHGLPDAFARRIARNSQLILIEEANLTRVSAPMTGTGWAHGLVDQLAQAAWSLFQEIEAVGGAGAAIKRGLI